MKQVLILAALILSACQTQFRSEAGAAARKERLTTDPKIALQNLDGQIEELEKAHARSPEALQFTGTLVGLLATRAQYLGRLSDYDRALALAEEAIHRAPGNASALLMRAGARSSLHLFSDAMTDIDQATATGAEPETIAPLRASIFQAQGHLREALAIWRKLGSSDSDIRTLGSLAVAEGEAGNRAEALRLFSAAVQHYRDVSPFPIAWIELQEGMMWERDGELAKAQSHYEAARRYVPQYAPATEHLASVLMGQGEHRKAAALLRPVADSCEDPELAVLLATTLVQLGDLKEGARYELAARERYEALVHRHPEAFGDHAARLWLTENPAKAFALARQNLANRRTPDAFELTISAALAAGEQTAACELADEALALDKPAPRIHQLAMRAFDACGQPDRADQERIAASASMR